jgi:hypothetical protein
MHINFSLQTIQTRLDEKAEGLERIGPLDKLEAYERDNNQAEK